MIHFHPEMVSLTGLLHGPFFIVRAYTAQPKGRRRPALGGGVFSQLRRAAGVAHICHLAVTKNGSLQFHLIQFSPRHRNTHNIALLADALVGL